jgi:AraC-like DNA-binding protein
VAFEGPIFDALETCGLLNCNRPVWRLGDSLHWLSRLKSIFPSSERPVDAFDQVGAMAAFLLSASAHAEGLAMPGLDRSHSWLTHARQKLETPGNEFRDLSSVARHCGLGYETFRKKFSALMGESPGQYRRRMLIVRAQNLMRDRELPDRAIADALGFCDEFHFSKSFKQVVGLSPRQWCLNETASASTRRSDVTSLPASEKARDKR